MTVTHSANALKTLTVLDPGSFVSNFHKYFCKGALACIESIFWRNGLVAR